MRHGRRMTSDRPPNMTAERESPPSGPSVGSFDEKQEPKPKRRTKTAALKRTTVPHAITQDMAALAAEHGWSRERSESEFARFRPWHLDKGTRSVNWTAAWSLDQARRRVRGEGKTRQGKPEPGASRPPSNCSGANHERKSDHPRIDCRAPCAWQAAPGRNQTPRDHRQVLADLRYKTPEIIQADIAQAESGAGNLEQLRTWLVAARRPATRIEVIKFTTVLVGCYALGDRDPEIFVQALAVDVTEANPTIWALEDACRVLRRSFKFIPAISEVLDALDNAESNLSEITQALERIPGRLERAKEARPGRSVMSSFKSKKSCRDGTATSPSAAASTRRRWLRRRENDFARRKDTRRPNEARLRSRAAAARRCFSFPAEMGRRTALGATCSQHGS